MVSGNYLTALRQIVEEFSAVFTYIRSQRVSTLIIGSLHARYLLPCSDHGQLTSRSFPQFNKTFGLPENPASSKGASLNGDLLGVDEFSMLQPSKQKQNGQTNRTTQQKVCCSSPAFFIKCLGHVYFL